MSNYACGNCGSLNVEHATWVKVNTNEVGESFGSWCAGDNSFCGDCEKNPELIEICGEWLPHASDHCHREPGHEGECAPRNEARKVYAVRTEGGESHFFEDREDAYAFCKAYSSDPNACVVGVEDVLDSGGASKLIAVVKGRK